MSIATQLSRLQADRNTIRAKLVELGLATGTDNLDKLATAIAAITDNGAITIEVKEGETFTIPAGFHDGSGTVSGIAGGGNYTLQSKQAIPSKLQQTLTPDEGYYGISDVVVKPIPDAYQDVTSVTAAAADVFVGKVFVASDGTVVTGTMTDNGAVSQTLDGTTITYTIPKGYHDGNGTVTIVLEQKSVTPTKEAQNVTPTAGKVLSQVTVEPIPDEYQVVTGVTTVAANVLSGDVFVDAEGNVVTGTMPNIGAVSQTLNTSTTSYTVPKGYHDGTGSVAITLEEKSTTPTKEAQTITPASGKVISKVTVAAIPDEYQVVTAVTAGAADVLTGKVIVDAEGNVVTGTMADNGAVTKTLNTTDTSYTVPQGYHNGYGTVSISLEEKTATPTTETQVLTPASGKVMSKVTVNPIPSNWVDKTGATAFNAEIDGLTNTSVTIPEGYTLGGTVTLTSDIEDALAAI